MVKKVKYLNHDEINHAKWDNLIDTSTTGKVFNYSWYLNQLCSWDAVIIGDYEAAIPLPVSRKWGIKALLQPNFIQQCNWIGEMPDAKELEQVKLLILSNFSFIHFNTNIDIITFAKKRDNLVLEIDDIKILENNFSKSLKKNIKKAKAFHSVSFNMDVQQTINLYQSAYGDKTKHLKEEDFKLIKSLVHKNPTNFINIQVNYNEETTASLLFAVGKSRIHYILGAPSKKGRSLNSLSYGLNEVLVKFANKNMILDFEGSSIKSVHAYYSSFGAKNEPFYEVVYSRPFLRPFAFIYNNLLRSI